MAMYPLNNVVVPDTYLEVILSPPRASFAMIVTGAALTYKLAPAIDGPSQGATYLAEVFCPPGRYVFDSSDFVPSDKCALISVKTAVNNVHGQVTIQ